VPAKLSCRKPMRQQGLFAYTRTRKTNPRKTNLRCLGLAYLSWTLAGVPARELHNRVHQERTEDGQK
jgi:hypothetical protein